MARQLGYKEAPSRNNKNMGDYHNIDLLVKLQGISGVVVTDSGIKHDVDT